MIKQPPIPDGATPAEAAFVQALKVYACPHCRQSFSAAKPAGALLTRVSCPRCTALFLVPGRLGDFVLQERIQTDPTGNLYRATSTKYTTDVCIKVFPSTTGSSRTVREPWLPTLRKATEVYHPHLARIHAVEQVRDLLYLVMELADGEPLPARLQGTSRLSEREGLQMALDIVDGLSTLHGAGLIHGNVQPGSILIRPDGSAKLCNPCLIPAFCRDATGVLLSAPHYAAPELIRGEVNTSQSDIYGLGVTLYHLFTGQPPYAGSTTEEIYKNCQYAVLYPVGVLAPTLSTATREVVSNMIRRTPGERISDCYKLRGALQLAAAALHAAPPVHTVAPARTLPQAHVPRRSLASQLPRLTLIACSILAVITGIWLLFEYWANDLYAEPPRLYAAPAVVLPKRVINQTIPLRATRQSTFDSACTAAVYTCTRRIKPEWQHITIGEEHAHGMTLWRGESVTLIGGGEGVNGQSDNARYMYTRMGSPYIASMCVVRIPVTHPRAQVGLLARKNDAPGSPCVFVGFTGNGNIVLLCRKTPDGELETIRTVLASTDAWHPFFLKLESACGSFRAFVSRDNATWECVGSCQSAIPDNSMAGISIAALVPNVLATAECRDLHLLVPPPAPR